MGKVINLAAFILPVGLFTYFGIIGYAALSILRTQRNTLQNLLLSPAIGIAFILFSVFGLNRLGLPVKVFTIPMTSFFLLFSIGILLIRKPLFSFKKYLPFAAIILLSLWVSGQPLLHFGFNWISYANDDMAHYCLGALRFLNYGYYDVPNTAELIKGKDYSQYYWFAFVPGLIRSGSELLIAWLSRLVNLNPVEIFMPLILSFHLILISATGAMLASSKRWYYTALTGCLLLTFSALTTLGTLYQLIAQVLGLSLLIAVTILLFQTQRISNKQFIVKHSILLCITACALLITYPEVAPMLGIAFITYLIINIANGWRPTLIFLSVLLLCLIESIVLLNEYWVNIISFVQLQVSSGLTQQKGDLFPYLLIPSGLANIWGFQTVAMFPSEPWASLSIMFGLVLSVLTLYFMFTQVRKKHPAAIMAFVMIGLATLLIIRLGQQSGFSLFKLSMYIQPFILGIIAIAITEFIHKKRYKFIALILIIYFGSGAQHDYVIDSYGDIGKSFSELPRGSMTHLPSELAMISKQLSPNTKVISDTASIVSGELQSLFLNHNKAIFYSNSFSSPLVFSGMKMFKRFFPNDYLIADHLKKTLNNAEVKLAFPIQNSSSSNIKNEFYQAERHIDPRSVILIDSRMRNIFNRREFTDIVSQNFIARPVKDLTNHLIFINSNLGQYYYLGISPHITLNNLEKDYFYPEGTMVGVGRYFLFQVVNPSKKIRVSLNMTESLNNDKNNALPHPQVLGDKHYHFSTMGRGSARVFSPAFSPLMLNNEPYFMLDMRKDGKSFATHYKGLMKLYGNNVPLDTRLLVGFVRDISIVSDDEYQHLNAPNFLKSFPKDLNNADLEYSGIYEDGWFSEDAYLKLSQPKHQSILTITGLLPAFETQIKSNVVTVYIDNIKVAKKEFKQGYFDFAINVPHGQGNRNIRLHFDSTFYLPKGDDRPVAAKIDTIGFESV